MAKPSRLLIVGLGVVLVCATLGSCPGDLGRGRVQSVFGPLREARGLRRLLPLLPRVLREWARRRRVDHRLSGRGPQLLGPPGRAHARHRQVRRQPPAVPRRRPARRPDAVPLSDALHGKRREPPVHRVGGGRASATTWSRAGFCGWTTSGAATRGRTGRTRSPACFRRRSFPSSTSPSRIRSCTPCMT